MIDEIRASLITAYILFVHEYGDPDACDKKDIEARIMCKVEDVFKRQRLADVAKKRLGEDFDKLICLYFYRYQTKDGFNHKKCLADIEANEDTLTRHLRKDAVRYIRLVASLMSHVDNQPKGLLAS